MRIAVRDLQRRRRGVIDVDSDARPTRVSLPHGVDEVFLTWESAIDDDSNLRRCAVCGCPDMFREKAFPQVTGFIVILAFAGALVGILGLATTALLIAMAAVLVLDVAILLFSRRRLVCYRCLSSYHDLQIATYHRGWDRSMAERFPAPPRLANSANEADLSD